MATNIKHSGTIVLTSPPSQVLQDEDYPSRNPKRGETILKGGANVRLPTLTNAKAQLDIPNEKKATSLAVFEGDKIKSPSKDNKTGGAEVVPVVKKPEPAFETENGLPKYDYRSQLLLYIPEDIHRTTEGAFSSFNQLSKSTKNSHQKLLETVLKEVGPPKPIEDYYDEAPKRIGSIDGMDSVKKVLELNKLQKRYYAQQIKADKKHVVLPLLQKVQEEQIKSKKMPHVRVLPSKHMYSGNSVDMIQDFPRSSMDKTEINPSSDGRASYSPSNSIIDSGSSRREGKKTNLKIPDDVITEQSIANYNYKVFWTYNNLNKNSWRPYVREGHSFTAVGRQVILYGGISTSVISDLNIYSPAQNTWTTPNVTGDVPLSGRYGHSAIEYKKTLVIFGGEKEFNPSLNFRECLNDTYMFIPERSEWKYMKPSGNTIQPRRHHAATVHENTMYVYGGITSEGNYIKDIWTLNLKTCTWNQLEVEGDRDFGIAFHTLSACFVSKLGPNSKEKKNYEEGLYVFGGKDTDGKISNTLKMIALPSKEPQWKYPATKGIGPTARYNHSKIFYEPLGILIVYGGRNEKIFEATQDICLKDIKILNLQYMTWSAVTIFGDAPQLGRYHHAVASFGTKMLIFGGVSFQKYADDEVKILELNPAEVNRLLKETQQIQDSVYEYKRNKKEAIIPILKDRTQDFSERKMLMKDYELTLSPNYKSWQPIPSVKFQDEEQSEDTKNPKSKLIKALSKIVLK